MNSRASYPALPPIPPCRKPRRLSPALTLTPATSKVWICRSTWPYLPATARCDFGLWGMMIPHPRPASRSGWRACCANASRRVRWAFPQAWCTRRVAMAGRRRSPACLKQPGLRTVSTPPTCVMNPTASLKPNRRPYAAQKRRISPSSSPISRRRAARTGASPGGFSKKYSIRPSPEACG